MTQQPPARKAPRSPARIVGAALGRGAGTTRDDRLDAGVGDVECMLGMATGRYTVASAPLWLGVAVALTAIHARKHPFVRDQY